MKERRIEETILKDYLETMSQIKVPMKELKKALVQKNHKTLTPPQLETIQKMIDEKEKQEKKYPKEQMKVQKEIIEEILEINNGVITTRLIEALNISRQIISSLEKEEKIEKIARGIYIGKDTFQDDFYTFQLKYKKVIFSHMNALYFHQMTEEIPYDYTVTVPKNYHTDPVNDMAKVFYVDEDIYEMGVCEVKTPNGNKVRAYDIDRCICDIIRSKNRLDYEQVKKSLRAYVKRKDKNMENLSKYAHRMNINEEVMEMVGMYYD